MVFVIIPVCSTVFFTDSCFLFHGIFILFLEFLIISIIFLYYRSAISNHRIRATMTIECQGLLIMLGEMCVQCIIVGYLLCKTINLPVDKITTKKIVCNRLVVNRITTL